MLTHARTRIDACRFGDLGLAAVAAIADAKYWGEGCTLENVSVAGCRIDRCGLVRPGAVIIDTLAPATEGGVAPEARGLVVEGCSFSGSPAPNIRVGNAADLLVSANVIDHAPPPTSPIIELGNIQAARLRGNVLRPAGTVRLRNVGQVEMTDNVGLTRMDEPGGKPSP